MQRKYDHEQDRRIQYRLRFDLEGIGDLRIRQIYQKKLRQLGDQYTADQPQRQRDRQRIYFLPQQHARDVALRHAQNVVQAEFAFAAANQERMCVKQEDHGEDHDHNLAHAQHGKRRIAVQCELYRFISGQIRHDVENHRDAHAGEQVRKIHAPVFANAVQRQSGIHALLHRRSPPVASSVSVSEIF